MRIFGILILGYISNNKEFTRKTISKISYHMKKLIAITFILLAGITSVSAQNWCGAVEHRQELYANKPAEAAILEKKLEAFNKLQQENSALGAKSDAHYIIPVVFHIIHQGGSENISIDQINDQMDLLNADFSHLNSDTSNTPAVFAEYAGDTNIEFRLAKLDPNGNCTEGVTRTFSNLTANARDNVKALIQWDPQHYLNVWIVKSIEISSSSGGIVIGFAQFPDQLWADAETDGVVVRHDYCGSIETASGNYGRTLTHEVGHWLNLKHIWGDSDCGSDFVNDTPTSEEPNYGVCTSNFPWHVGSSYCSAGASQTITQASGEMFMNYMDYSDDYCMNMFSLGQGARMRSAITTYRNNLVNDANIAATGTGDEYATVACAPIAEFTSNYIYGCAGDGFNYNNETYNTPTDSISSFEWTFEGGTPATSSEQNPSVDYNESGVFMTTLTVTNSVGSSTISKESYVTISADDADMSAPYFQNFESSEFPTFDNNPHWNWSLSASEDLTWERTTQASSPNLSPIDNGANNASYRIRSSEFDEMGEVHTLLTPSIDLSNTTTPIRGYFDLAHARKNGNSDDQLLIHVSDNCGRSWTKRFDKGTDALATNGGGNSFFDFVPTDSQWEQYSVNLNAFAGESNVILKFEFSGSEGNWLYIDNFVVCNSNELSLEENLFTDFNIYPNPSKGDATIEFELYQESQIQITLSNVYGSVLAQQDLKMKATNNSVQLKDLYTSLKAGIYFVLLSNNGASITKKVVITE